MENKIINLAEILKDCPQGMRLNCMIFDDVVFERVDSEFPTGPIILKRLKSNTTFRTNKYGHYYNTEDSKCVIFPEGKTTWEGFVSPCKFKDGDIVATNSDLQVFILQKAESNTKGLCYIGYDFILNKFFDAGMWAFDRLATEEEKEKFFNVIKKYGFKWNADTKTLENLIEKKFEVGDNIRIKGTLAIYVVTEIREDCYMLDDKDIYLLFKNQDQWEQVPDKFDINTLKPFDKVLVRHDIDNKWNASLFSFIDKDFNSYCYKFVTIAGKSYPMMIPYEGNKHLLGTTNDCEEYYKTW